jgi:hypothetical protein
VKRSVVLAVEGSTDEAVLRRTLSDFDLQVDNIYGSKGKQGLDRQLKGYNHAARYRPWVVLRDLDHDAECAPSLAQALLPNPAQMMCFRLAVRAVEAWLLADREAMAAFLGVAESFIPVNVEALADPKRELLDLVRRSRSRSLQTDMIPAVDSTARIGPGDASRIIEYVYGVWRPEVAARHSDSLRRLRRAISSL